MKAVRALTFCVCLVLSTIPVPSYADGSRLASVSVRPLAEFGGDAAFPPYGVKVSGRYWLPPLSLKVFEGLDTIQGLVDYVYRLGDFTQFYVGGSGGVGIASLDASTDLASAYFGAALGANVTLVPTLSLDVQADAGYLVDIDWSEGTGGGFFVGGQVGFQFSPIRQMSVTIGGRYSLKNPTATSGYQSFGIYAEAGIHFHGAARETVDTPFLPPDVFKTSTTYVVKEVNGEEVRERIEVDPGKILGFTTVELDRLFPVLYKYYERTPFGSAVIINNTGEPVRKVKVSFFVDDYMSDPWPCVEIEEIAHGEEVTVDIYGLFKSRILEITEPTKVSAKAIVDYDIGNERMSVESVAPLALQRRNAITWDDDRKAAAYVTAGDPVVLKFSNNVSAWIRDVPTGRLSSKFVKAMAIHEALRRYGMTYSIDPTAPFTGDEAVVDFPKFPVETLNYSAGDCDDLSILYCSLLESVGIETAFITIPAHIYMAFKLDMSPDEARQRFLDADQLILRDGATWVPVEITLTNQSFVEAWREGAKEWRRYDQTGEAAFYPNHLSWHEYEPVQLPASLLPNISISMPDRISFVELFTEEISSYIDRELFPQVTKLEERIESSGGDPRYINRLAVLYAQYGLYDRALAGFGELLARQNEFYPALVNMGNIHYLKEQPKEALEYYEQALEIRPDSEAVLLGLAQAHNDLENYGTSTDYFARLRDTNPQLADEYSYLGLGSDSKARASQAAAEGKVEWEDDEE